MLGHFNRQGFIFIRKYDKNQKPINYEMIEEIAIESEAEEVEITCDEDKIVPALEVSNQEEEKENANKSKKSAKCDVIEEDETDDLMHWRLIVSEEGLLKVKGLIEKNYPDLIIKEHTVEYVPREPITLDEKELEVFHRFCSDLSGVEEFEKVYTNVNC